MNYKKYIIVLVTSAVIAPLPTFAAEPVKLKVECNVSGTKISGDRSAKQFIEQFDVTKSDLPYKDSEGKTANWGISKVDLISDGKKYDISPVSITPEHVVISISKVIGAGYNRKLLTFVYILDVRALELDRSLISVPSGLDERTHSTCRKID